MAGPPRRGDQMNGMNIPRTLLRLFFYSLIVGLVLSAFNISPESLLGRIGGTVERIFDIAVGAVEWAVPFVLIGAVVVVPIWLVVALAIVGVATRLLPGRCHPRAAPATTCDSIDARIRSADHPRRRPRTRPTPPSSADHCSTAVRGGPRVRPARPVRRSRADRRILA